MGVFDLFHSPYSNGAVQIRVGLELSETISCACIIVRRTR